MLQATADEITNTIERMIVDWGQQDMEELCLLVISNLVEVYGSLRSDRTREEIRYGG